MQFLIDLALGLAMAQQPQASPAAPPPEVPAALLVVEERLLASPTCAMEIEQYRTLVRDRFGTNLILVGQSRETEPARLRALIQEAWKKHAIKGVFLVGRFRFARFRGAADDECACPAYYEDLDGEFLDQDQDGLLDYWDPWLGQGGVKEALEVWLAVLRPPPEMIRSMEEPEAIVRYFRKVNHDLVAGHQEFDKGATVLSSESWPDLAKLRAKLDGLYDLSTVVVGGTKDRRPVKTGFADYVQAVGVHRELLVIFLHGSSERQYFDLRSGDVKCIVGGAAQSASERSLGQIDLRARVIVVFSCRTLDLDRPGRGHDWDLADAYLLSDRSRITTLLGTSRDIGMESIDVLVRELRTHALSDAWTTYQNHLYSQAYLRRWLGERGVFKKEARRFNWGYMLYGNPFLVLGERMTVAK